ncbi:regulator of microtubule dynamics protein 2 [Lampris incognitus]|uniref:regulator of microtubule dynamics protein 2 n=1 Tax=Lampris incognitus TaxID=2546036 RepID=UPI0024B5126D|nr:regulator of microtubule dynamics protein 2 [Lampris incognitus]
MAQADNKVLVLGALAGVAGISLAAVWYQGLRSRRRSSWPAAYFNSSNERSAGMMMVNSPVLPNGQAEVLERLETLMQCVSELKDEMKALKNAMPLFQDQVREELKGHGGAHGAVSAHKASALHRATPTRRKKAAGAGTRAEAQSSEDAESEGGYMTALTDSEEEEPSDFGQSGKEEIVDKLLVFLDRIDILHQGTESDKRESLNTLLKEKEEFGQNSQFLWRLTRAYCDVHDISSSLEEKKTHAEAGKNIGEEAVRLNPSCAESHQWYAIMCGIMAEYDTVQNRIKNGYIFKDHLDKAIELKPQDPMSYYLLGRWCYAVAQLSWIERKVAATLFGEPPSATVQDALKNFLKVEELHPKYSKLNYVFLAKCYRDLGQKCEARNMCEAACSMDTVSKEDKEAQKELDSLWSSLGV